jgi:hypothetical protein
MRTTLAHADDAAALLDGDFATVAECGCGGACENIDAWCRECGHRSLFHVVEGDVNPIEYWTCESGAHTYSRELMTQSEIFRESRRGGWH